MEKLYCFKFDDITGEITRVVISDYSIKKINNYNRYGYKFCSKEINKSLSHYFVENSKLDRFASNKVFTFHDDIVRVKEIIRNTLKEKSDNYYRMYARNNYLLEIFDKRNNQNE